MEKGKLRGVSGTKGTVILRIIPTKVTMTYLDKIFNIFYDFNCHDDCNPFGNKNLKEYKTWLSYLHHEYHFEREGVGIHIFFTPELVHIIMSKTGNYEKVMGKFFRLFKFTSSYPKRKKKSKR